MTMGLDPCVYFESIAQNVRGAIALFKCDGLCDGLLVHSVVSMAIMEDQ